MIDARLKDVVNRMLMLFENDMDRLVQETQFELLQVIVRTAIFIYVVVYFLYTCVGLLSSERI